MALITVKPVTLLQGSVEDDGTGNSSTQLYAVQLDGKPSSLTDVLVQAGTNVPARGATDGQGRTCTKRTVARLPNAAPTDFIIECTFETPTNGGAVDPNPLARKDDISFDIDGQTESFFVDYSDPPKRLLNTNGERFDTLPERTTGGVKLVIEGNRATFNAAQAVTYCRPSATNDAAFTVRGITIATGQAKIISISGKPAIENNTAFWRIKWDIALAPDWKLKIENMGFTESVDGVPWPIMTGTPPEPITSPWPLNEDGTAMPNRSDEPFVITFKPYPARDFSVFNWTAGA